MATDTEVAIGCKRYQKKFDRWSSNRAVIVICVCYALIAFFITYLRYISLTAHMYDLGMFDQAIWHAARGRGLYSPLLHKDLLAHHFMPVLYLLAPFYWFGAGPEILLLIQSIAIAVSGWFLARLTHTVLRLRRSVSVIITLMYLSCSGIQNSNVFDFHPENFLPMIHLGILFCLFRSRWIFLSCFVLLALSVKEHVGLEILAIGVFILLNKNYRLHGLAICIIGMFGIVLVSCLGNILGFGLDFVPRYSWMGSYLLEISQTIFLHPLDAGKRIFIDHEGFQYILKIMLPVLGICLFSPKWLIPALPMIAINLFADFKLGRSFRYHYQVEIMPWIFLAAAAGWKNLHLWLIARYSWIPAAVLLSMVFASLYDMEEHGRLMPFSDGFKKSITSIEDIRTGLAVRQAIKTNIPPAASVAATGSIVFPELTHRLSYRMLPNSGAEDADYFIVDLERLHWDKKKGEEVLGLVENLKRSTDAEIMLEIDDRILFLRKQKQEKD